MHKPIILLGKPESDSIQRLSHVCEEYQFDYFLLDTEHFFEHNSMFLNENNQLILKNGDITIDTRDICSIFWDSIALPSARNEVQINTSSWLQVLFKQKQLNWCNSWAAFQFHKTKPLQLQFASKLGANTPASYFGNDIQSALKFIDEHAKCIIKPIHGGAATRLIDTKDRAELRLLLAEQAMTIQRYIEGTNVRTYVIGTVLFSAIIETEAIDFRQDERPRIVPITLPKDVEKLAYRIMQAFDMKWTAIDWRRNELDQYVFLEANPAPRFVDFESLTQYPIAEHLFRLLSQERKVKRPRMMLS